MDIAPQHRARAVILRHDLIAGIEETRGARRRLVGLVELPQRIVSELRPC